MLRLIRPLSAPTTTVLMLLAASLSAWGAKPFFQRGVNFTAEGPDGYTGSRARPLLEKLGAFGVDSIALVPYAFTSRSVPSVRFGGGFETDEGIEQVATAAHALGMKVLLKPQVWVRTGFPGDLEFTHPSDRAKWFAGYRTYIEHQAALATRIRADLFCVGVEFVKLSSDEKEWRRVIARVREIYRGPLTYGATQGQEFENLQFWDALDYIGLNNYYPLPDDLSTAALVRKVEAVQRRFNKPVLLTETGFSSYESPHRQPWDETPRKVAQQDQARCYEAIFRGFYGKPWFYGMYWWKVGTDGHGGPEEGSFTPWGKPAMQVMKRWYTTEPVRAR